MGFTDDRQVTIEDRKRIRKNNEVVFEFDATLLGREVLRAQEARSVSDRVGIDFGRGAADAMRDVPDAHVEPTNRQFPGTRPSKVVDACRQLRPFGELRGKELFHPGKNR